MGLMKAGHRFGRVDPISMIFSTNAAHKTANKAAFGNVIEHGKLFGDIQRIIHQWQGTAQNGDFRPLNRSRQRTGHHPRNRHQSIGRLVMLVDRNPIKTKFIGVSHLIEKTVIEFGSYQRIVMAIGKGHPGATMFLDQVGIEIGVRH